MFQQDHHTEGKNELFLKVSTILNRDDTVLTSGTIYIQNAQFFFFYLPSVYISANF